MRYPTLTRSKCETIVKRRLQDGSAPNWELELDWVGSGKGVDLSVSRRLTRMMRDEYDRREVGAQESSPEAFEGRYSGGVHFALRDLPVEALDDPGFWRYLAVGDFWWFVAEREAGPISRGNVMNYVDGGRESVPLRMFLRGQAIQSEDDYSLASALPASADFWRSHIIRVRTGTAPSLARAFVRLQVETQMTADEVRPLAKRLNRLWSNIVFHLWDEDECYELLRELHGEIYGHALGDRVGSGLGPIGSVDHDASG